MKSALRSSILSLFLAGLSFAAGPAVSEAGNQQISNAWARYQEGAALLSNGQVDQAIVCLTQTVQFFQAHTSTSTSHLVSAADMTANAFMANGNAASAEDAMRLVLAWYESRNETNQAGYADACRKTGLICYYRGHYADAIPLLHSAALLYAELKGNTHPETAKLYHLLGANYYCLGRYADAESWYTQALSAKHSAFGTNHLETARTLNNLAILYDAQAKYDIAEPLYRQALAIKEQLLGPDHPDTAHELNNLAILYQIRKQYDKAEPLLRRALNVRLAAFGTNSTLTAQSLNNLAGLLILRNQPREAEPLLQLALAVRRNIYGTNHLETAQSLHSLAQCYAASHRFDEAGNLYDECLAVRIPALGSNHQAVAEVYRDYAALFDQQSNYFKAAAWYEKALKCWEAAAGLTGGESFSDSFRSEQQRMCASYIQALNQIQLSNTTAIASSTEKAFYAMELARARRFLDQLSASSASWRGNLSDADRAREEQLRNNIKLLQESRARELMKPAAQQNQSLIVDLGLQLGSLQRQCSELEKEFSLNYPRYMEVRNPSPVTIAEMQSDVLVSNEVFLCFWEGESRLFACCITRGSYGLYALPYDRPAVKRMLVDYLRAIIDEQSCEQYKSAAYAVYTAILQPFLDQIDCDESAALIVVPHGMLSSIPLEALVTSTNGSDFSELSYLFEKIPVTYVPSAMALRAIRADIRDGRFSDPSRLPGLLVGDPVYTESQARQAGLLSPSDTMTGSVISIEALPATRTEIETVATILYGSNRTDYTFSGKRAQESILKSLSSSNLLTRFRLLHFATHAFLPGDIKGIPDPCLALSLYGTGAEDGLLNMTEIFDLDLDADLVTLSSCQTGWIEGRDRMEGISGLARSFFFAGTPSLLVTLMDIDDDGTAEFMRYLYSHIYSSAQPASLVQALNATRGHMLSSDFSHPIYWAPFILVGEWR